MKRRKFVLGLGAATFGGATTIGSGAFTSTQAERSITVGVVQDSDAFLKLDAEGSVNRSSAGDVVEMDFPGIQETDLNPQDPDGVNANAVTRFSSEPDEDDSDGLLRITNQGTQSVDIYSAQDPEPGEPVIDLFDVTSGSLLTEESPYSNLSVGDELKVGVQIDTTDVSTGDYDLVLAIIGKASGIDS